MIDATAKAIITLVPHLPDATRRQLRQMLANSIAAPTPAELREARLGLLIELVADGTDATAERYEETRAERAAGGEHWPSRSQLSRAYGTWLHALDAAAKLAGPTGTGAGAPSHRARSRVGRRYARSDLLLAIQRCSVALGVKPDSMGYDHWRRLAVRAAREHGQAELSLPSRTAITKRFGTWARAVNLAMAATAPPREGAPRQSMDSRVTSARHSAIE